MKNKRCDEPNFSELDIRLKTRVGEMKIEALPLPIRDLAVKRFADQNRSREARWMEKYHVGDMITY